MTRWTLVTYLVGESSGLSWAEDGLPVFCDVDGRGEPEFTETRDEESDDEMLGQLSDDGSVRELGGTETEDKFWIFCESVAVLGVWGEKLPSDFGSFSGSTKIVWDWLGDITSLQDSGPCSKILSDDTSLTEIPGILWAGFSLIMVWSWLSSSIYRIWSTEDELGSVEQRFGLFTTWCEIEDEDDPEPSLKGRFLQSLRSRSLFSDSKTLPWPSASIMESEPGVSHLFTITGTAKGSSWHDVFAACVPIWLSSGFPSTKVRLFSDAKLS